MVNIKFGVVIAEHLNVRKGPGARYPVIAQLRKGDEVTITHSKVEGLPDTWYCIGLDAWVIGDWVRLMDSSMQGRDIGTWTQVVFIASPYMSSGSVEDNVRFQMEIANQLIEIGYTPIVPLLFHFQNEAFPQTEKRWKSIDLTLLLRCDVVLRVGGPSEGADFEVQTARLHNIPVHYSIETMVAHR